VGGRGVQQYLNYETVKSLGNIEWPGNLPGPTKRPILSIRSHLHQTMVLQIKKSIVLQNIPMPPTRFHWLFLYRILVLGDLGTQRRPNRFARFARGTEPRTGREKGRSRVAFFLCLQLLFFLLHFGPQVCLSWDGEKGGKLGTGDAVSLRRYAVTVRHADKLSTGQSAVCRPQYKSRSKTRDASSNYS